MADPQSSVAYDRGYKDFRYKEKQTKNGVTSYVTKFNHTNPFKAGSNFAKEWERGFNAHYFENLKYIKAFEAKSSRNNIPIILDTIPVPDVAETKEN